MNLLDAIRILFEKFPVDKTLQSGGYKELSSILADQYLPRIRVQMWGAGGGGGVAGSQPMSTAVHKSPHKVLRSNYIFNL